MSLVDREIAIGVVPARLLVLGILRDDSPTGPGRRLTVDVSGRMRQRVIHAGINPGIESILALKRETDIATLGDGGVFDDRQIVSSADDPCRRIRPSVNDR